MWEEQNFDFPLALFLHRFPSFVFAAHRAAFAFGALFAFGAHFDLGLHAMFLPPYKVKELTAEIVYHNEIFIVKQCIPCSLLGCLCIILFSILQGRRSNGMMKKSVTVLLLIECLFVAGCNTMKGLGKDIKKAG